VTSLFLAETGAYAAIVAVAVAVPGPDFAIVVRNAVRHGTAPGLATVLGIAAGTFVHVAAAAAGLTVLLAASRPLFTAVQLAGAAYLAYLAVTGLRWLAVRGAAGAGETTAAGPRPPAAGPGRLVRPFRQGLLTNLTNPKVVLFYLALMPHFVGRPAGPWWPAVLPAISVAINAAWFGAVTGVVHRWGAVLRRPAPALLLDVVPTVLFLGASVWLVVEVARTAWW
jgi:threonine/homoserine/homoserine lactone efflux protein